MNTHNMYFHDKKNKKMLLTSLNICFLKLYQSALLVFCTKANSFLATSLGTNAVVVTRVHCISNCSYVISHLPGSSPTDKPLYVWRPIKWTLANSADQDQTSQNAASD